LSCSNNSFSRLLSSTCCCKRVRVQRYWNIRSIPKALLLL
jgi:hypothetical protein